MGYTAEKGLEVLNIFEKFLSVKDHEGNAIDKKDPLVVALKEWVDKLYEDGRVSSLSNVELEEKIDELSGGRLGKL